MGDYMNFKYTLKEVSKLCGSEERLLYTPFYKFEQPNSHRIQGGLRTGNGHVTAALILFPDSDDKDLVWPAQLSFKLLAHVRGKIEVLGTQDIEWDLNDVEQFSEDIHWRTGVKFSLKQLKENNIIGHDDSLTFVWAVQLRFPPPAGLEIATPSTQKIRKNEMESEKDKRIIKSKDSNLELEELERESAETEIFITETIRLFSVDMTPAIVNLDIEMEETNNPKFEQKYDDASGGAARSTEKRGEAGTSGLEIRKEDTPRGKPEQDPKCSANSTLSTAKETDLHIISTQISIEVNADTWVELLERGRQQNAANHRVLTLLMIQCLHGDKEKVVEAMSGEQAEPDINVQGPWGMTALMFAAWKRRKDVVKFLIEENADVNLSNDLGMSALMIATINGHTEIVKLLVENRANVDMPAHLNSSGTQLLRVFISMMLKNKQFSTELMSCRLTCLIVAAKSGRQDIVRLLLDHVTDINTETQNGMTALKAACFEGHFELICLLIEYGANVNSRKKKSVTPIMLASVRDNVDIITLLLEKGAEVNASTARGITALMVAAHFGSVRTVRMLIDKKADVNAQDIRGCTSLMFATAKGHTDIVHILLDAAADPTLLRDDSVDALTIALAQRQTEIASTLLTRCSNKIGNKALEYASIKGDFDSIKICLEHGADANKRDSHGKTSLMYAAMNGDAKRIKVLLDHDADVDANDHDGKTALMYASMNGDSDSMQLLLCHDADVNKCDKFRMTPLLHATKEGKFGSIVILLNHGADVNMTDIAGKTPLMYASKKGDFESIKILLEHGSEANRQGNDGMTALMFASLNGESHCIKLLLDHCKDVDTSDSYGMTALLYASMSEDVDSVKLLLLHTTEVDIRDNDGMTSLMHASVNGNIAIITSLLKAGANIHARNYEGMTSLSLAFENRYTDAANILLKNGAKPDLHHVPKVCIYDALVKASSKGHADIVNLLLERGADINARDGEGLTSLMAATKNGHLEVVKQLLKEQTYLTERDMLNVILTANQNGHSEILQTLLSDIQIRQTEYDEPMHKHATTGSHKGSFNKSWIPTKVGLQRERHSLPSERGTKLNPASLLYLSFWAAASLAGVRGRGRLGDGVM